MAITGTLINIAAVLVGGTLGTLLGSVLPARFQEIVLQALGLATLLFGTQMALKTANLLYPLLGILFGSLAGEALNVERTLNHVGHVVERQLAGRGGSVAQGFVTASLVFCVGPITIVGALNNGLTGDIRLLEFKSVLDGFAAFGFAASFGPGVLLSTVTLLFYQGGISVAAGALNALLFSHLSKAQFASVFNEMTAVGGLMVLAVGLRLLKIAELRVGNFLPAIVVAPGLALLYQVVAHR